MDFFKENPHPFYELSREIYPDETKFKATPGHYFIKLLSDRGLLLRCYTQNIDCLENQVELPDDELIACHGSYATTSCIECKTPVDNNLFIEAFKNDKILYCKKCKGLCKPDITFFGEALPDIFHKSMPNDCQKADLVIVMGTSLKVFPVAGIPDKVSPLAPRLLINRDIVHGASKESDGNAEELDDGFRFNLSDNYRDVLFQGDCDDGVVAFCEAMDEVTDGKEEWRKALEKLVGKKIASKGKEESAATDEKNGDDDIKESGDDDLVDRLDKLKV